MLRDRYVDRGARRVAEPHLEDGRVGTAIRPDPMDDQLVIERCDRRTADAGHRRHDAHTVETATEEDAATVACAASGGDPADDLGVVAEMLAHPWLPLCEERGSPPFVLGSDRTSRDGDHDPTVGVDDDPQDARPRGPSERVWERAAGQFGDRGGLGRHGRDDAIPGPARAGPAKALCYNPRSVGL